MSKTCLRHDDIFAPVNLLAPLSHMQSCARGGLDQPSLRVVPEARKGWTATFRSAISNVSNTRKTCTYRATTSLDHPGFHQARQG